MTYVGCSPSLAPYQLGLAGLFHVGQTDHQPVCAEPLTPAFLSEGSLPDVKVPCQPGTTVFTPTSGSLELLVQWGVDSPACGQGCQVGLAVEGIHLPGAPLTPVPGGDSPIRFPLQVPRSGSVAGVGESC